MNAFMMGFKALSFETNPDYDPLEIILWQDRLTKGQINYLVKDYFPKQCIFFSDGEGWRRLAYVGSPLNGLYNIISGLRAEVEEFDSINLGKIIVADIIASKDPIL